MMKLLTILLQFLKQIYFSIWNHYTEIDYTDKKKQQKKNNKPYTCIQCK